MTSWRARLNVELGDFSLDLDATGEDCTAVIGPNGSGKTTLLRAFAGVLDARTAEIVVGGRVLASTSSGVWQAPEERRIGYVPQGYGLFAHLSVVENVAFGLRHGRERFRAVEAEARARTFLNDLSCLDLADRSVGSLSGGEKQRVALARALATRPDILLLDEPMAALDAKNRRVVRRFLEEHLSRFAGPTLLVTHDVRDVASLCSHACVLDNGRVVQMGTLEDLRREPINDFVAEFVALD